MKEVLLLTGPIAFCLAMTFLFSGFESGVFALNRLRIRQRMRAGDERAMVLLQYLDQPESFLWTILAGNTLAIFFAVDLAFLGLFLWIGQYSPFFWASFCLYVISLYTLADLLPKTLFHAYPDRLCLALAKPFRVVYYGLSPVVNFLTWLSQRIMRLTGGQSFSGRLFGSREELRLMMQESAHDLTSEERQMINRVMDFQNLTLRHIAIPMERMVVVEAQTPMSKVLEICQEKNLTRLLVARTVEGKRRVLGLVSLKNVLYLPNLDLQKLAENYVRPAIYLMEDLRLEQALRKMQRSGQRLAIVLGRDRQEVGAASLQDILKAIFGEVNL